jgi:hypothetical protein
MSENLYHCRRHSSISIASTSPLVVTIETRVGLEDSNTQLDLNVDQGIMFSRAIRPLMRSQPLVSTVRTATFTSRVARPAASVTAIKAQSSPLGRQKRVEPTISQAKPQRKAPSPVITLLPLLSGSVADQVLN